MNRYLVRRSLGAGLLAFVSTTSDGAQISATVEGFQFIREMGGIAEYRLESNDLTVLLKPEKLAPVATVMVTYRVGSRNEVTGTTGATHLLEHLMFKGTERFNRSKGTGFDQLLDRTGADSNATTWLDRTNYFETVPREHLPLAIELEADRMRNLLLLEEDRQPEMTVVRNEFERGENDPKESLDKAIWAAAFTAHPYHHPTIGWRSDIEKVSIEKLREFYDTFYWPNNATVTVIGDFDPAETLNTIKKQFGAIKRSPRPIPEMYTEEPPQRGPRRVIVKRAGELGVVALAHKIPPGSHPDWHAVDVLSAILTKGKISRYYRQLTDKNQTTSVDAFTGFNRDPSLHVIYAELVPGVTHESVERTLVAEIERIRKEGVSDAEVETAVAKLVGESAYSRDGSYAQATDLNEAIAVGDWTLYVTYDDKLRAVKAADVQRVAAKYFDEDQSVTGWFIPTQGGAPEVANAPNAVTETKTPLKEVLPPKPMETGAGAAVATQLAAQIERSTIAGVDTLICPTGAENVVTIRGSLRAGESASENRALAHLTASMLDKGTVKRTQFELADQLEKVGATIDFEVTTDTLEFTAQCLSEHVALVVSLLAEQLRSPAFAQEEFAKVKKQALAETQQALEDTDTQAAIAFAQAAYPPGHPSRRATIPEQLAAIEKTTLEDVKRFHETHFGAGNIQFVAVGDVKADDIRNHVKRAFEGWGSVKAVAVEAPATQASKGSVVPVPMAEKTSVSVIIGQPNGTRVGDPEWLPLTLGTAALGRGFTSRLVGTVRDREGLTYGIGAGLRDDTFRDGTWVIRATFAPALLEKGLASTRRELQAWYEKGITADELAYRKSAMAGGFAIALETTEGLAEQILRCVQRGFPLSWLDEFPAKVRGLTLEQVNSAIRKQLNPDKMITAMAGTLPE